MSSTPVAPPQDLDAEAGTLGAVLLSERTMYAIAFEIGLEPEHFYRERHQLIFAAMRSLYGRGEPIDVLTVCDQLDRAGHLDRCGGRPEIDALAGQVPVVGNIRRYAEITRDLAAARAVLNATYQVQAAIHERRLSGQEVTQLLQEHAFQLAATSRAARTARLSEALGEKLAELEQIAASGKTLIGLSTGIEDLDALIGGMQGGQLHILAARPAMGKTMLAQQIARHVAFTERAPVIMASLEMSQSELTGRHLSAAAGVNGDRLRNASLTDRDWQHIVQAAADADGVPLTIIDEGDLSVGELHSHARAIAARDGDVGLIVVDYLQLMRADVKSGNRTEEVSQISRSLKQMARALDVPVLALCQLSRKVEDRTDKRPMLSDLRESGQIEADANTCTFMYRDDYYYEESDAPGEVELIVAKNRGGALGTARVHMDAARMRLAPVA